MTDIDFRSTSLHALAHEVRSGQLSARELTEATLARIESLDRVVHAFVAIDGERSMEQAAAVDQIVATGGDPGPLAGVPLAVKDLEDAAGFPTTFGSPLLGNPGPAVSDSVLVGRLRSAGCVVVGKTNTPEFGWAPKTDNARFGTTRNPWSLDHSPGGSSGGTAAALAAGMVPLGTGSDGGGSIRIPASCCGLSGMKPSLGRVPAGGLAAPQWPDLSTKGPMARSIADTVAALAVVVGPDASDLRALPRPDSPWPAALSDPHVPSRVAWSPTLGYAAVDAEVLRACEPVLDVIESLGSEIVEVESVFDEDPLPSWLVLAGSYLLRSMQHYVDRPEWEMVDPGLRLLLESARSTTAVQLVEAIDYCQNLNLRLVELFHEVRLLVTPTLAALPPPIDLGGAGIVNGVVDSNWVRLTYPFNMTRSPAATVCAGLSASGLPIGVQLIGPQHGDLVVLRSAAAIEEAIGFDAVAPLG